ncbi:MAG TPA: methyl-accepting chemotaxis protein [Bryobacteraceae bacterium]|jgi:methyl-accepting chemotaxis protein
MKWLRDVFERMGWRRRCLAVIPVLRGQLRETADQAENAVRSVCDQFQSIADESRSAVERAADLLGGRKEGAGIERSIETSRSTIADLLERLERAGKISALAIARMERIEESTRGMEALLHGVQRISFHSKLVALNAKIEAVHVGELGSGFEVVADEITRQADESAGLAGQIEAYIAEMRERVKMASDDLRAFVAGESERLAGSRREAEDALGLLQSTHRSTRESVEAMAADARRLADRIASAVVGLQYQDRMNQRVSHVIEALEQLESAVGGRSGDLMEEVRSGYTMEAERAVLARTVTPVEGDVELF